MHLMKNRIQNSCASMQRKKNIYDLFEIDSCQTSEFLRENLQNKDNRDYLVHFIPNHLYSTQSGIVYTKTLILM